MDASFQSTGTDKNVQVIIVLARQTETARQRDRQRDRQSDRQRDREKERQRDRQRGPESKHQCL